jgi:hypothetical protein
MLAKDNPVCRRRFRHVWTITDVAVGQLRSTSRGGFGGLTSTWGHLVCGTEADLTGVVRRHACQWTLMCCCQQRGRGKCEVSWVKTQASQQQRLWESLGPSNSAVALTR